jgi:hypothetical protein
MRIIIFWDVMPCSLVEAYQTMWHHNLEDSTLHGYEWSVDSYVGRSGPVVYFRILAHLLPGGTKKTTRNRSEGTMYQ